jgi:hypothetical protein
MKVQISFLVQRHFNRQTLYGAPGNRIRVLEKMESRNLAMRKLIATKVEKHLTELQQNPLGAALHVDVRLQD